VPSAEGRPGDCQIPVALITTLTESEDRVRGIEAGADEFLSKPPVIAELEARVRSLARSSGTPRPNSLAAYHILPDSGTLGRVIIEARASSGSSTSL
jgi:DNA-binding response OmpR family regulator